MPSPTATIRSRFRVRSRLKTTCLAFRRRTRRPASVQDPAAVADCLCGEQCLEERRVLVGVDEFDPLFVEEPPQPSRALQAEPRLAPEESHRVPLFLQAVGQRTEHVETRDDEPVPVPQARAIRSTSISAPPTCMPCTTCTVAQPGPCARQRADGTDRFGSQGRAGHRACRDSREGDGFAGRSGETDAEVLQV